MKAQSIKRAFLKKFRQINRRKQTLDRNSFEYLASKKAIILDCSESGESQSQNLFIQPVNFRELFLNIENQDAEKNYFDNNIKIR